MMHRLKVILNLKPGIKYSELLTSWLADVCGLRLKTKTSILRSLLLQVNGLKAIYNLIFIRRGINVLVVRMTVVCVVIDYCHHSFDLSR